MPKRTTQWKWMALGGLLCLVLVVVVSKWRDDHARASGETPPPVPTPLPTETAQADKTQPSTLPSPLPVGEPLPGAALPAPAPATPADPAVPMTTPPDNTGAATPPGVPLPNLEPPLPPTGTPTPVEPATTTGTPTPPSTGATSTFQSRPLPPPSGDLTPAGFKEPTPEPTTPPAQPPANTQPPAAPPQPLPAPTTPTVQQVPFVQPSPATTPPSGLPASSALPAVSEPGEPPLVGAHHGPTQVYRVRHAGETVRDIARRTLGTPERAAEILRLNPEVRGNHTFAIGDSVQLPADACIAIEDLQVVKPLPPLRKETQDRARVVLPLTGTFASNLDDRRSITLPRSIREQLGNAPTLLVSPGPDQCLWLTNQAHLDRLAERLEKSAAREADVRVFKRLYFAQTEKLALSPDGRVTISERLAQFAGLHQEVVLVGIDDHFELWDVARWRQYTQEKSAAARAADDSD